MEGMFNREGTDGEFRAPESVRSAAILWNGEVYAAATHGMALLNLKKTHPEYRAVSEGFVTSTGRFVSREEAKEIAERAEQLNHLDEHQRKDAGELGLDSSHLRH